MSPEARSETVATRRAREFGWGLLCAPVKGLARARAFLRAETAATDLPLMGLLAVAVVVHVVVLLLAVNPLHPDEHYQILEFAWARAGLAPLDSLAWEYSARIRPALQPSLAMALLEATRAFGATSPYPWMLLLRIGTLAVSLCVTLWVFAAISPELKKRGKQVLWLAGPFLWFAPLLMFRFTAENLSGLALVAALPLVETNTRGRVSDWSAGALLGLSFVFRFPTVFAVAAVLLWVTFHRPGGVRDALRMSVMAAAVVGVSSLVDVWFYGEWVFTPWLYFQANILAGVASSFGTSPWYMYLAWAPRVMAPPLSLVVLALMAAGLALHRRSVWTWTFVAFLLGHSMIAHKEIRFLFPLVYFVPVLAARGADVVARSRPFEGWRRVVVWGLVAQSIALTLVLTTPVPHRKSGFDAHYKRWLWDVAETQPGTTYLLLEAREPGPRKPLVPNVYRHPRLREVVHEPGQPVPKEVTPGTPPGRLLLLTLGRRVSPEVAGAKTVLGYASELGYRVMARRVGLMARRVGLMARRVGLADTRGARWLEAFTAWTSSNARRRVYHVRPATTGQGP